METIRYVQHLEWRIRIRRIPRTLPERIYREAEERFHDTVTGHDVAVKSVKYAGRTRQMLVVYDRMGEAVELVTAHPLRPEQKAARLQSGRWQRL